MCAIVATIATVGCNGKRHGAPVVPPAAHEPEREVIATVDGEAVSLARFNLIFAARSRSIGRRAVTPVTYLNLKRAIARDLTNELLVTRAAKRRGVTASDAEITARRDILAASFTTSQQRDAYIASFPQQEAGLRRNLEIQILEEKLAGVDDAPVREDEARAFYARAGDRYHAPAYLTAQEIVFPRDARAKALEVEKLAADPKQSFGALAHMHSRTPKPRPGGDMGRVTATTVDPAVWKALQGMKPGQVSKVIESPDALRIVKLLRINPAVEVSFEQAKADIERSLKARRKSAAIADMRAALHKEARIDNAFERRNAGSFARSANADGHGLGEVAKLPHAPRQEHASGAPARP